MIWRRKQRSFLELEAEEWQLKTWKWLRGHSVGVGAKLILPTADFFPATNLEKHARVVHIFETIKRLTGMQDWACELIEQIPDIDLRITPNLFLKREGSVPAGTYLLRETIAEITYEPALVDQPTKLIATLIHELSHYRQEALPDDPPGGKEGREPATDLCTVALGFGIFGASCAFVYRAGFDSWSASRLGYLTEREWTFALAVWLELEGYANETVRPYLKASLYTDLHNARRYILKKNLLGSVKG